MGNDQTTQSLLMAGIAAAGIFFLVATIESLIRPGFNLSKHAVSMLSLGDRGWLMMATFIVSGALTTMFAAGVWRATGAVAAPLLLGLYGLGLVMAGVFPAPAALGFPPGTPEDLQPVMNTPAVLHSIAFMLAFGALIVACFVLAANFWAEGSMPWAVFCVSAGIAMPALVGLGMSNIVATGVAFYASGMVGWLVVVAMGVKILRQGA
ncbi:MAG: DUF998 domain-containing protein [Burkholderiaceae bacterium]|nr:DUF998 domain-containing protein [Burkholderiaceae bacterium]